MLHGPTNIKLYKLVCSQFSWNS